MVGVAGAVGGGDPGTMTAEGGAAGTPEAQAVAIEARSVSAASGAVRASGARVDMALGRRDRALGSHATIGIWCVTCSRPLREAWIVDAVRTPIGRYGGALAAVRPDDLAAVVIARDRRPDGHRPGARSRTSCSAAPTGPARTTATWRAWRALLAGLPVEVAGQTVNRLCGSGLQAVNTAAHAIGAGDGEVFVAGGVESMTRAPYVMLKADAAWDRGARAVEDTTLGWRFVNPRMQEAYPPISLGETAECVADQWTVSRERQDAFALQSQRRAIAAIEGGRFDGQLVPVSVAGRKGAVTVVDRDEHPRADTSAEALAALKPAFKAGGTVTAGNSSGINDGAAALLLVEADRARALGLRPMARVVATAVAGVHPDVMGIGPVPAVRKVLGRAGLDTGDLDVIEINEAFASQSVACMDELGSIRRA